MNASQGPDDIHKVGDDLYDVLALIQGAKAMTEYGDDAWRVMDVAGGSLLSAINRLDALDLSLSKGKEAGGHGE